MSDMQKMQNRSYGLTAFLHASLAYFGRPLTCTTSTSRKDGDVVVVLGGAIDKDGQPSIGLRKRVQCGAGLVKRSKDGILIVSGGAVKTRVSEAAVMKDLALQYGVLANRIVVEDRAKNTYENARYVKELLAAKDWRTLIIVTSPYHLKRALYIFRSVGLNAIGVPAFDAASYDLLRHLKAVLHEYFAWIKVVVSTSHPK